MSASRVMGSTTSARSDTTTMTPRSPLLNRGDPKKPKPQHKSRKERRDEKNQLKKSVKKEATKPLARKERLKEKAVRKRAEKKERKAAKKDIRNSSPQQPARVADYSKVVAIDKSSSCQRPTVDHTSSGAKTTPVKATVTASTELKSSVSKQKLSRAATKKPERKEVKANANKSQSQKEGRHDQKTARKATKTNNRREAKTVARREQQQQTGSADHGSSASTDTKKPSLQFGAPHPGTSIVNRYRSAAPSSESPSEYTIPLGEPLFPTASQGGDKSCKLERKLFHDFLHARKSSGVAAVARTRKPESVIDLTQSGYAEALGARASSPIDLDEDEDEDDEGLDYPCQFQAALHSTEYLVYFGDKSEERKPDPATLNANNRVDVVDDNDDDDVMSVHEAVPTTKTIEIDENGHHISFDSEGREMRDLSYFNLDSDDDEGARDDSEFDMIDFEEFGDEVDTGKDFIGSENEMTDEEENGTAVHVSTHPWRSSSVIDLTQGNSGESDTEDGEEDVTEVPAVPALAPTAKTPVHITIEGDTAAAQAEEGSDTVHERRLNRSIDRELQRTANEADKRLTNPLEQLLAVNHGMLFSPGFKVENAALHASFEFIRGLRAEHSHLNSQAQGYENDLKAMRSNPLVLDPANERIGRLEKMHSVTEGFGENLLVVENDFRENVAKEQWDLKLVLKSALNDVKKSVEVYDRTMAEL